MSHLPPHNLGRRHGHHGRRGFTITELMISVVLVLLLTLAIGVIFRTTSEVIGKGTATGDVTRNLGAVRTALTTDFTGTDTIDYDEFTNESGILPNEEQVAIVIASNYVPTFTNEADFEADGRANYVDPATGTINDWTNDALTVDFNNDGDDVDADEAPNPLALLGRRTFRTDQLTFAARGSFESQVGVDGVGFTTPFTTPQALVWYGHLRLFNNDYQLLDATQGYGTPGSPRTNPANQNSPLNVNNRFADQFALGRVALLLSDYNYGAGGGPDNTIVSKDGGPVLYADRNWTTPQDTNSNSGIAPFVFNYDVSYYDPNDDAVYLAESSGGTTVGLNWGRSDVLASSALDLRERLAFATETDPGVTVTDPSYQYLPYRGGANASDQYDRAPSRDTAGGGWAWWQGWFWSDMQRFWANPFGQQPFDARAMSQRFHYLTPGARQFVVEYAGDYFIQDGTGLITGVGADGTTDFYFDPVGRRAIRFYGFPRDVDGDNDIQLFEGGSGTVGTDPYNSPDVLPLKDHFNYGAPADPVVFPHEKIVPAPGGYGLTDSVPQLPSYGTAANTTPQLYNGRYVCAWGPDELDGNFPTPFNFPLGPKLIRIIVEASDPEGALEEPIQTELVFRVPE